jgi:hypothetical protein
MDPQEVVNCLKAEVEANFFEVYEVHSFEGYRETADGSNQEVNVKILDMGPGAAHLRYSVKATSEDGKVARGNPAGTIDEAIAITHWIELDRQQ